MTTANVWVAAAIAVAAFLLGAIVHAQPVSPKPGVARLGAVVPRRAPAAVVLVVDRAVVLRQSAAGKSIYAQVEALAKKLDVELAPENERLQADTEQIRNAKTDFPEARQSALKKLEARRQAFVQKVQQRQGAIQGGLAAARDQVDIALGRILDAIMIERGANLLIDRGYVALAASNLDITPLVIQRLNAALPKVTVTPVAAPAKTTPPSKP